MAANPDDQLPLPHFEDQLWAELAALHRTSGAAAPDRPGDGRGNGSRPARRPWNLLAAAAAAAVVLLGLTVTAVGDDGGGAQIVDLAPTDEVPGEDCVASTTTIAPASEQHATTVDPSDPPVTTSTAPPQELITDGRGPGDAGADPQADQDGVTADPQPAADDCPPSSEAADPSGGEAADDGAGSPSGSDAQDAAEDAAEPAGPAMVVFQEQLNVDGRIDHMWFDEESGRMRSLQLDAAGNPAYDSGWLSIERQPDGSTSIATRSVDYVAGTYTDMAWTPPGPLPESWRHDDDIEQGIADGTHVADGTEVIDGRELLRYVDALDGVADPSLGVTWYDPETRRPVRRLGYPGSDAEYTHTYQDLPRTPENLALLDVPIPAGFVPG